MWRLPSAVTPHSPPFFVFFFWFVFCSVIINHKNKSVPIQSCLFTFVQVHIKRAVRILGRHVWDVPPEEPVGGGHRRWGVRPPGRPHGRRRGLCLLQEAPRGRFGQSLQLVSERCWRLWRDSIASGYFNVLRLTSLRGWRDAEIEELSLTWYLTPSPRRR